MPALWTWTRQQVTISTSADGEGWFKSAGWNIAAPESLQRVVIRADVSAQQGGFLVGNPRPYAGGNVRLQLSIADDETTRIYYAAGRNLHWSQTFLAGQALEQSYQESHCWITPFDVDLTIRRAAPPPPSAGMILGIYMNWSPDPFQSPADHAYITPWWGDIDVLYLTSQPTT